MEKESAQQETPLAARIDAFENYTHTLGVQSLNTSSAQRRADAIIRRINREQLGSRMAAILALTVMDTGLLSLAHSTRPEGNSQPLSLSRPW